jgi:hypothetical protein
MEPIRQAIHAATDKLIASGKIEEMIEKCVTDAVKSGVESALRSYGDFGKTVDAAVKQAVQFDPSELSLPAYNEVIINLVRNKVEKLIHVQGAEQLAKHLDEMIGGIAPAEIKLSEIVDAFRKECIDDDGRGEGTVIVEKAEGSYSGQTWHIYLHDTKLDRLDRYSKHRADYQIDIMGGNIYSLKLKYDQKHTKGNAAAQPLIGKYHGFSKLLYQAYCVGSKIVVDETEFTISNDYD